MKKLAAIGITFVLLGTCAWADETPGAPVSPATTTTAPAAAQIPAAAQSVTTAPTSSENPLSLDKFYVGYYGDLQGSQLNQLGSPYQVNQTTGQMTQEAMTFASDATLAYMVTPDVGVGAYMEMNITPVLGEGWGWTDIGVTTFDKKLISKNGFTLFANAILEKPVDSYDIQRGMVAGFETTPYVRYVFPNSRFSTGAWLELKSYDGATSGKLVKTYYEPYVAYELNPQLSLNLNYELEYDYFAGTSGMQVYETDIQPGVLWYLTPKIMLNPYLQWFTNNKLTADTACFGAAIVARFL